MEAIISLGGGIMVGIVVGVFARIFLNIYYSPDLLILKPEIRDPHYGVFVKNTGKSAAINCEVMLTLKDIDFERDVEDCKNVTIDSKFRGEIEDMNLSWARMINGNKHAITIYPGAKQLLDFFEVKGPEKNIIITSEKAWNPARVCLKTRVDNEYKEYKGELKVFAENVKHEPEKHCKSFIIERIRNEIKFKLVDENGKQ